MDIRGGTNRLEPIRYAFIDGNYLQFHYDRVIKDFFRKPGDLNMAQVKAHLRADRVFYYDAVDESRRDNERSEERDSRVKTKKDFLSHIRSLDGFHVPEGSVSRSTKRRKRGQKEVDVLLAVDAMAHAFHKNMGCTVLMTGDLDFRPLVEHLVYLGTYVELWHVPEATSAELLSAVDFRRPIKLSTLYGWSSPAFVSNNPIPTFRNAGDKVFNEQGFVSSRHGRIEDSTVTLFVNPKAAGVVLEIRDEQDPTRNVVSAKWSGTKEDLVTYADLEYGPITWTDRQA